MGDLLGPDPVLLPGDPAAETELAANENPAIVAAAHPTASVAWAVLAEDALADDKAITAYAYARTGYHRGLDQLRRNGWKGFGPVPYSHEPNRGFLRSVWICSTTATRRRAPNSGSPSPGCQVASQLQSPAASGGST